MKYERGKNDNGNPHRRVLVVDDDPDILLLLQEILRQEAYAVDVATSAKSALESARAKDYDLILLDRRLPDMDARDIVDEINHLPQPPTIIMMSAYTSLLQSTIEALRREVYDYLAKPFDVDNLKLAVQRGLERKELLDVVDSKRRLELLYDVAKSITANTELNQVLDMLARKLCEVTGLERCLITMLDEKENKLFGRACNLSLKELGVDRLEDLAIPLKNESASKTALDSGTEVVITEASTDPRALPEWMERFNLVSFLVVPMIFKGKRLGVIYLDKGRARHNFSSEEIKLAQLVADQAAISIENANLYRAEQKKVSQYSTLANMSSALIAEIELQGRLKVILQSSVAAVKAADAGIIFLYDEYNDDLVAGCSLGLLETAVGKVALKPNEGFVGQVFQTGGPLMLSNTAEIAACAKNITRPNLLQLRRAWGNILFPKGILCVPFILRDKKIGILVLFNLRKEGSFTDDDCSLIQSAANVGAQAIAVAQLMEALKIHEENLRQLSLKVISAQEEERKRVARELHDEMTQALIALKLHAETVKKEIPPKLAKQRKGLEEIDAIINRSLEDVHRLITDLRPVLLDDLGLIPALKWHIRNYSKRYNIEVTLKKVLNDRLPAGIEVTLYRIIQEALSNVAKHAQAENVEISLEKIGSQVKTTIVDDGIGFDAQELHKGSARKGFGLLGICERASLIGGTCEIKSSRGRGTILEITLPISTEEQMYQGAKA